MTISDFFLITQGAFLVYFILLHGSYLSLNVLSIISIWNYMQERSISGLPNIYTGLEIPVSIIAPAYNEQATIVDSVKALLNLNYPDFEVIVINDGSSDNTIQVLIEEFELIIFPEAYLSRLSTQKIKQTYISKKFPNLRVIDKQNGGKADALNAGINVCRFSLFCAVDADSIIQTNSLEKIVQPFLEEPTTVAVGGTVRIANGCSVKNGFLVKAGLPNNLLALFQVAEYLRGFLFGRLGWSPLNALLIISGAFGLFHKNTVISVGGYLTNTIGEDMELIVRLHRELRAQNVPYRISFVPDPICWTEAPEDFKTLRNQRIRWQRGLSESLEKNTDLLFAKNSGAVGWLAMPFMLIFEWLGPIIELLGIALVIIGYVFGYLSTGVTLIFFAVAIGFGVLLSVVAVLLEEMSFHIYPKLRYIFILLLVAILENFGYRQLNTWWRLIAIYQWSRGQKAHWGEMKRSASWVKQK